MQGDSRGGHEDNLVLNSQDSQHGRGENIILMSLMPSVTHKCYRTGGGQGKWSLGSNSRGRSQGPTKVGRMPAGMTRAQSWGKTSRV